MNLKARDSSELSIQAVQSDLSTKMVERYNHSPQKKRIFKNESKTSKVIYGYCLLKREMAKKLSKKSSKSNKD